MYSLLLIIRYFLSIYVGLLCFIVGMHNDSKDCKQSLRLFIKKIVEIEGISIIWGMPTKLNLNLIRAAAAAIQYFTLFE
jgi:hypothetical protein